MAASIKTIRPEALKTLMQSNRTRILDVRTDAEYYQEHIPGSIHIPLDKLDRHAKQIAATKTPLTIVCRSGKRATDACAKVTAAGFRHASVLEGGLVAWTTAGGETVRSNAWSLERQVRVAAGSLVVIGTILAFTVSPLWVLLSGFVGAGLVFAGVTDTCGMAMLLARMPWNSRRTDTEHAIACLTE